MALHALQPNSKSFIKRSNGTTRPMDSGSRGSGSGASGSGGSASRVSGKCMEVGRILKVSASVSFGSHARDTQPWISSRQNNIQVRSQRRCSKSYGNAVEFANAVEMACVGGLRARASKAQAEAKDK